MRRAILVTIAALLLLAQMVSAQVPVSPVPDWASYGTAAVNPTIAAVEAWRSPSRACRFGQLAISEAVGNVAALTLKHFIVSARPCLGCIPDGDPSGHAMNSMIGFSARNWGFGLSLGLFTGDLRYEAHRHFPSQIAKGLVLGALAEGAGHLLRCPESP